MKFSEYTRIYEVRYANAPCSGYPYIIIMFIFNFQESLNMKIPTWAKKIYPEPLHTIASYQCLFENYNTLLRRLNGGMFI